MNQLEKAIKIALDAHSGQTDKAGKAYILHPLRLMLALDAEEEQIVAVLHDVVEDSDYTFDDIRAEGFSQDVINALECVTKLKDEPYDEFIERIATNSLATKVKLADLRDNSNLSRIPEVTDKDRERVEKYMRAIARLEKVI